MKYGIMGGTFSPIHMGHLILAEEVKDRYFLDKILFIPSGTPPHKEASASAAHRAEMVRLAIADNPDFKMLDIEIKKKNYSYTIDTVRALKKKYPSDDFVFITGADSLTSLDEWHDFEELAKSISFVGANRPGYHDLDVRRKVEVLRSRYGFDIKMVEIPSVAISSSMIRERVNLCRNIIYMVPREVEEYISENDLYTEHHEDFDKIREMVKKNVKTSRYVHSLGVAKESRRLAIMYDADYKKAELAGMAHDFAKGFSVEESRKLIDEYGIEKAECIVDYPPLAHGEIAAEYFRRNGIIEDDEILDAIRWHTYGTEHMSTIAKIVYVADIIEENRPDFPGRRETAIAARSSLEEAILVWRKYAYQKPYEVKIHPNSPLMYAQLEKELGRKK